MGTRAAIYARISSDRDGEAAGVTRQLEDCRALVTARGWAVAQEYVDNHTSAWRKNAKRPRYDEMVADFKAGRFDALVCYDLDRLTRQPRQLEDWIDAAEDRGLHVVTANGEADLDDPNGRMFARIKATVARGEADSASRRIKRASDQRHRDGLYHGGTIPYGYRVEAKQLVPRQDEVAVIHEAIDRLLKGDTLSGIVKDWQRQGRTTRGGKIWRVTGLRPILRNRALLGETKLGEIKWEPVVDVETFERLDRIFSDPERRKTISPGVKGGRYSLGGGLTVCGSCGATMTSYKRGGDRNQRPGLRCAKYTGGCGHMTVDYERLETYVFDSVIAALEDNPRWQQRTAEREPQHDREIARLEAEKSNLEEQGRRVRSMYVEGLVPEQEMRQHVTRVNTELATVNTRMDSLLGTTVLSAAMADGLNWRAWNVPRRRNFIRLLVSQIVVDKWPEGMATGLPKRRTDTDAEHTARIEAHHQEAIRRRVTIVPR